MTICSMVFSVDRFDCGRCNHQCSWSAWCGSGSAGQQDILQRRHPILGRTRRRLPHWRCISPPFTTRKSSYSTKCGRRKVLIKSINPYPSILGNIRGSWALTWGWIGKWRGLGGTWGCPKGTGGPHWHLLLLPGWEDGQHNLWIPRWEGRWKGEYFALQKFCFSRVDIITLKSLKIITIACTFSAF